MYLPPVTLQMEVATKNPVYTTDMNPLNINQVVAADFPKKGVKADASQATTDKTS